MNKKKKKKLKKSYQKKFKLQRFKLKIMRKLINLINTQIYKTYLKVLNNKYKLILNKKIHMIVVHMRY